MHRHTLSCLRQAPRATTYYIHGRLTALAARRFPWLYLVTDNRPRFHNDRPAFLQHIERAIIGGVDVVQYRDKTASDADFRATAKELHALATKYDVTFIINDRVDVALDMGCWLHVGRTDWPRDQLMELRERFDQKGLRTAAVGYSIDAGNLDDTPFPLEVDYLGVGPLFATKTKADAAEPMGIAGLEHAVAYADGEPIVAIGGVTLDNVQSVMRCGCAGVAVIGEIMDAEDPQETARKLKEKMVEVASRYRHKASASGAGGRPSSPPRFMMRRDPKPGRRG